MLLAAGLVGGLTAYSNLKQFETPQNTKYGYQGNGQSSFVNFINKDTAEVRRLRGLKTQPPPQTPRWSLNNYAKKATQPISKTQLPTRPIQYKNIPMTNLKPSQKLTPPYVPGTRYFRSRTIRYKRRIPVRYRRKRKTFSKKKKQ